MGDAMQTERRLFELAQGTSSTTEGLVVSQEWNSGVVTVNVGGTEQTMPWAVDAPWPGDTVRVVSAGRAQFCVPKWGAPNGLVKSVSSNVATVLGDDGETYKYPCDSATAVGWRVELSHRGRRVLGRYLVEPAESEFIPQPPPPSPSKMSRTFYPKDSANYQSGEYKSDAVEVSDARAGYYFYGTQIRDTIPNSASIISAKLQLVENWDQTPGVASRLGYHTSSGMHPASPPALSGAINVSDDADPINVISYASALQTGAAYGLGFPAGFGWRQFGGYVTSGAITITWSV